MYVPNMSLIFSDIQLFWIQRIEIVANENNVELVWVADHVLTWWRFKRIFIQNDRCGRVRSAVPNTKQMQILNTAAKDEVGSSARSYMNISSQPY